jgi:hypothetical protein
MIGAIRLENERGVRRTAMGLRGSTLKLSAASVMRILESLY